MSLLPTDTSVGPWANFVAGTGAGLCNALVLNPMSAVKYKTWGRDVSRGVIIETLSMWKRGGLRPFGNGLLPTIYRDVVFGGCYTFLRFEYQHHFQTTSEHQWVGNFLAAMVATVLSGPFNFVRNVQYATKSQDTARTTQEVLERLWRQVRELPTASARFHHLQGRLRIGWGTARVAIGMALGHFVYDECMHFYHDLQETSCSNDKSVVEGTDDSMSTSKRHLIPARRNTIGSTIMTAPPKRTLNEGETPEEA